MIVSLAHDPPCFGNYYKKQLAVIDWAKACTGGSTCSEPFANVDWSAGVGIAGHSMGGQATLFSSAPEYTAQYDIRTAVMHHAFSHTFPAPSVPFLDFTSELDTTAPADTMGLPIYKSAEGTGVIRAYVDKALTNHHGQCHFT